MSKKVYELAFKLGANMHSSFGKTFQGAGKQLTTLNTSIAGLQKHQKSITAFSKLQGTLKKTSGDLEIATVEMRRLKKEVKASAKPTKKMLANLDRATKKRKKVKRSLVKHRAALGQLSQQMRTSGIHTARLASENERLARSLDKVGNKKKRLTALMTAQRVNSNKRQDLQGRLIGAAGLGYAAMKMINPYGNIATAQGGIASLGIGEEGIQKITQAAINASNTWSGITAPAFITGSYDIKSGISSLSDSAVAEFTRMAAVTAKATKFTTEKMTGLYATGFGIYRKQFDAFGASTIEGWENLSKEEKDKEFGKYFSAGIASSVQQFKTTGDGMSQFLTSLGSKAVSAGVSMAEQLAVGGILQQTMSGSEGSTKYESFLANAFGAGEKLGLDFTNADTGMLKELPDILDMIKEQYGKLDAAESEELKKAFGTDEAVALLDAFIERTDELRESTKNMNVALASGMKLPTEMAKKFEKGPNASIGLLSQRISNLSAAIGKTLDPALSIATGSLGWMAMKTATLVRTFPVLSGIISGVTTVVIAGTVATTAAAYAYNLMEGSLLATRLGLWRLAAAQKIAAVWSGIITAKTWLLNAAMAANPAVLIVGGVIVALGLLVALWLKIRKYLPSWLGGTKETPEFDRDILKQEGGLQAPSFLPSWLGGEKPPDKDSSKIQSGLQPPPFLPPIPGGLMQPPDKDSSKIQSGLQPPPFLPPIPGGLMQPPGINHTTMKEIGKKPNFPGNEASQPVRVLNIDALKNMPTRSSEKAINLTVSPTIHIAAGANESRVRQAVTAGLAESAKKMRESLEEIMNQDRRLSYE